MKRSKIFLGVTTCLLAIVGIAATKTHRFTNSAFGCYPTKSVGGRCTRASAPFFTNGSAIAFTIYRGLIRDVYTQCSPIGCPGATLWKIPSQD